MPKNNYQQIVDDLAHAIEDATSEELIELKDVIGSLMKILETQIEIKSVVE